MVKENFVLDKKFNKFLKELILNRNNFVKKKNIMIKLNNKISLNNQKNIIIKTLNEN